MGAGYPVMGLLWAFIPTRAKLIAGALALGAVILKVVQIRAKREGRKEAVEAGHRADEAHAKEIEVASDDLRHVHESMTETEREQWLANHPARRS